MPVSPENARASALQYANRVVAQAGAAKATDRATRAASRNQRRTRGRISLAPVSLGRDLNTQTIDWRVPDPTPAAYRDPEKPLQTVPAKVNARVDILFNELVNKRIDEPLFCTGRLIQAVFEKAQGRVGGGGWQGGDRVDAKTAQELNIIRALETANEVKALEAKIIRQTGIPAARMLRRILIDGVSLQQEADRQGKGTEYGRRQVAGHFRIILGYAAGAFEAHGSSARQRDTDPWIEGRRGTDRASDGLVRGERAEFIGCEETDENGVCVPEGQGYRIEDDPSGERRWQPDSKRKGLVEGAQSRLRRQGGVRR